MDVVYVLMIVIPILGGLLVMLKEIGLRGLLWVLNLLVVTVTMAMVVAIGIIGLTGGFGR